MGVVCAIKPKLRFPLHLPFEITDQFNGPHRGTWWFRDGLGHLHGPYWTYTQAYEANEEASSITPYQDQYGSWWWSDENHNCHGPYTSLRDADTAIVAHNNPKDT